SRPLACPTRRRSSRSRPPACRASWSRSTPPRGSSPTRRTSRPRTTSRAASAETGPRTEPPHPHGRGGSVRSGRAWCRRLGVLVTLAPAAIADGPLGLVEAAGGLLVRVERLRGLTGGRVLAGRQEDHALGHLPGAGGEALVAPPKQGHVDRGGHPPLPLSHGEQCEQVPPQVVHRVVLLGQRGGLLGVPVEQHLGRGTAERDSDPAHLGEVPVDGL